MGRLRAIAVGVSLLLILMTYPVAADTILGNDVTIDAAEMEYDIDAKAVTASGNVVLQSPNAEIRADKMVYYDTGWVEVPGKAHIKTDQGEFEGDGLRYHVPTKTGEIKHLQGKDGNFYFKGDKGTVSPEEDTVEKGSVTRCEKTNPCYRLHAGRIRFQNGHVIIERGYIDILRVPVFPIFYLNLDRSVFDNWPDIKIGSSSERGVFMTYRQNYQMAPSLTGYSQVGIGTDEWYQLGTGLGWSLWKGMTISASGTQEWSDDDNRLWRLSATQVLWQSDHQSLYAELFREGQQADRTTAGDDYDKGTLTGLRLNYSPKKDLTVGLGWADAEGSDRFYGDSGWGLESTLHWKQPLGQDWRFTTDASYHWNDEDDRWIERKVSLTHYFHCISATVSRDFEDDDQPWQVSFGIRW